MKPPGSHNRVLPVIATPHQTFADGCHYFGELRKDTQKKKEVTIRGVILVTENGDSQLPSTPRDRINAGNAQETYLTIRLGQWSPGGVECPHHQVCHVFDGSSVKIEKVGDMLYREAVLIDLIHRNFCAATPRLAPMGSPHDHVRLNLIELPARN